jgi:hypothetical protein
VGIVKWNEGEVMVKCECVYQYHCCLVYNMLNVLLIVA